MARIDSLIEVLADQSIPLAAMQPGQPVMLDKGGGESEPLNDREISARQIELLLSEVLSSEQKSELRASGRIQFEYETDGEPVTVTALHRAGKLSVYFSLAITETDDDSSEDADDHTSVPTADSDPAESGNEASGESTPTEAASDRVESTSKDEPATASDLAGMASGDSSSSSTDETSETTASSPAEARTASTSRDVSTGFDSESSKDGPSDFGSKQSKGRAPNAGEQPQTASSDGTEEPAEEVDVDELEMSFEDDTQESSFVDASAPPTSADQKRGQTISEPDERQIPMKPPGTSADIDKYLRVMAEEECSDLHLTSGNPPLYRKDGEITHLDDMDSLSPDEVEELLLPIIPDRNYEEFLEIRDTDFSYEIRGVGRFRCNIFMDRVGPGGVFRLIPDELMTAEDLDLADEILDLCSLNKGFVLVTGPTGSGKSTTLAALIDYINRNRTSHIITLEDPIEFVHPNKNCLINQREIGVHTMGFSNAIRAALREDPDIVLVGELRDLETIELALETAETGHLVFGTLHTNTAPSTVDRIIDQFPTDRQAQIRTMLAESLRAVIAQTLCKRVDGGRIAAMEVLMVNNAVSNLIREGKSYQIPNVMETSKGEGMVKLNDALMEHVEDGIVSPDEAYFNAVDKQEMRNRLERAGHRIQVE